MQTGFQWSDFGPLVSAFVASSDPVRFMLDIPFETTPGKEFNYCSGAASVFAAALAKKLDTDLRSYAEAHLFQPSGIKLDRWDTDPLGRYIGSSEMYLTPLNMLKFGLLYLYEGRVKGRQVLSHNWIRESTAKQAELEEWDVMPGANGYGYYWWRRNINGHQAYVASGYGEPR
jgi:CubicO group peptidase (beta-lactamase class C family)